MIHKTYNACRTALHVIQLLPYGAGQCTLKAGPSSTRSSARHGPLPGERQDPSASDRSDAHTEAPGGIQRRRAASDSAALGRAAGSFSTSARPRLCSSSGIRQASALVAPGSVRGAAGIAASHPLSTLGGQGQACRLLAHGSPSRAAASHGGSGSGSDAASSASTSRPGRPASTGRRHTTWSMQSTEAGLHRSSARHAGPCPRPTQR